MHKSPTNNHPLPIRARILGAIDIRIGDTILGPGSWSRRQARSVLLLLLGTPGHRLPRDLVLDAIWPDYEPDASLNALYKALHALRRTLEPELRLGRQSAFIDLSHDSIALKPHDGLWIDTDDFERMLREAETLADPRDHLRGALSLYRGDFMADERYIDWPVARRESLRAARRRATLTLARIDLERGTSSASIGLLEALLADDPAYEEAHQAIVRALLANGQRSAALQQIERCRLALDRDLGVGLDPETAALAEVARRGEPLPRGAILREASASYMDVPALSTLTIGRRSDIAAVHRLLTEQAGVRMVTIVGAGGVGKTRLAVETARGMSAVFSDGIAFVDLTAIRDAGLLIPAIADALKVQPMAEQPLAELVGKALLQRPRFLLVLDNLEHLDGIAIAIAALLETVSSLKVLATSREPLRIRAEWLYRLDPLAVPDAADSAIPEQVRKIDSVALFIERATAWGASRGALTSDDLSDVAALSRRLEGLPLAIELAAARTWQSSPATILVQLENRFEALRDGPRDLPARHRALQATIDWSYELLDPSEQALFCGLSVFAGGVEVDALEALFSSGASAIAEGLAEKSLVRWSVYAGSRRLEMLEAIRDYAELKLIERGEDAERQRAHARFFADLAARADERQEKRGAKQLAWMQRLERDRDNVHVALSNSIRGGDAHSALAITCGMGFFWLTRYSYEEALCWIEQALALDPTLQNREAGWTATWGAEFAWRLTDRTAEDSFVGRARRIWRWLNDANGLAWVDGLAADRHAADGRFDEAIRAYRVNSEFFRRDRDAEGVVASLTGLACALTRTGRPAEAVEALEAALIASREEDNFVLQSYVLARLGTAVLAVGDVGRVQEVTVEGERIAYLVGDRRSLPWSFLAQAAVSYHRRDFDAALNAGWRAYSAFRDAGDRLNEGAGAFACAAASAALGLLDEARAYARACLMSPGSDASTFSDPSLLGYPPEALDVVRKALAGEERRVVPAP